METKVIESKQGTLSIRDFLIGGLLSVAVPVLLVIQQSLDQGIFTFNWKQIAMTAIGTFISYIIKNLVASSRIVTIPHPERNFDDAVEEIKKVV